MKTQCIVVGGLVLGLVGCDPGVDEPAVEERLLDVAEYNGFDVSEAVFDGENLIIGDVELTPDHLGEYELAVQDDFRAYLKDEDNKVVSPGFRDICFEIDNDGANSAEDWVATFNAVTQRMNQLNTSLSFINRRKSVGCPSSREKIEVVTKNFWDPDKLGSADWPTKNLFSGNVKPGKKIKLSRDYDPTLWWQEDFAQVIASHELMHALGFLHIDSSANGDHVSGTCVNASGCDTIMFASGNDIPSVPSDGLLSDDEDALETVY